MAAPKIDTRRGYGGWPMRFRQLHEPQLVQLMRNDGRPEYAPSVYIRHGLAAVKLNADVSRTHRDYPWGVSHLETGRLIVVALDAYSAKLAIARLTRPVLLAEPHPDADGRYWNPWWDVPAEKIQEGGLESLWHRLTRWECAAEFVRAQAVGLPSRFRFA